VGDWTRRDWHTHDPDTTDLVFIAARVVSFLSFALLLFVIGFGFGSACTDIPGNGGLDQAPCNRVTHAVQLNSVAQGLIFVVAWIIAGRRRSRQWMAWALLVASLATSFVSIAIAKSY
jgi:hypothetical protein